MARADDQGISNGMVRQDLRQRESEHTGSPSLGLVGPGGCSQGEWTVFVCSGQRVVACEVARGSKRWKPEVIWPTWLTTPAEEAAAPASPLGELRQYWATAAQQAASYYDIQHATAPRGATAALPKSQRRSTRGARKVNFLSGYVGSKKRIGAGFVALAAALVISVCGAGCGSDATVTGTVGYQPPFLPLIITIDSAGNISLHGELSVETPAGTFFLEANISKDLAPVADTTLLIIEHRRGISTVYSAFRIKSQQIDVSLNGRIQLNVTSNQVFVNAVSARVQSIVIRSATAAGSSSTLNACLVGTWRDSGSRSATLWDGHEVAMYGGAGNIDHIFATGIDRDSWGSAEPMYGMYQGHTLEEIMRGDNTLSLVQTVHGDELQMVEDGWSAGSANRYIYEGHPSLGYFNKTGAYTSYFKCTWHLLTWRVDGVVDTETRISRQP